MYTSGKGNSSDGNRVCHGLIEVHKVVLMVYLWNVIKADNAVMVSNMLRLDDVEKVFEDIKTIEIYI